MKKFIFSKIVGLQAATLLRTNSLADIFQGFSLLLRNSYFNKYLSEWLFLKGFSEKKTS